MEQKQVEKPAHSGQSAQSGQSESVIGLEVHVQLDAQSKLFCRCSTDYRNNAPNHNVCVTCTSHPGAKPWGVNESAIKNVVKIALALGCKLKVGEPIFIQRKHYFYPDLASGYQRTSKPFATGGELLGVGITEVHLEEDPGNYELKKGLVDFNRSGIPLIEIVTDPDMTTPSQAREFLEEISAILDYLNAVSSEPGSMRVDANFSIRGHPRAEVKNINSFKGVYTALTFEHSRHLNMIKNNLPLFLETRHFDEAKGSTITLRRKETVDDYRYFPDPDVPPIVLTKEFIDAVRKELPELPREKRERFVKSYKILPEEAFAICLEKLLADAFEKVGKKIKPQLAAGFFRGVLRKQLNYRTLSFRDSQLTPDVLVELLSLVEGNQVTEKVGEQLLIAVLEKKASSPKKFAQEHGLIGVADKSELEPIVDKVIAVNPKPVKDFLAGEGKALHFLAGIVMKQTHGKADPAQVQAMLKKKIK
ncbi:Asp-tRNA(Asn)/Glu-tRNA(Gln) amidotransferase subunit GatB [Candidatus Micrarchaeota archaeon]|nr:Asp-tRNA(Asn)/Glu-tRNA(Gln) amidotransferase subunit GatB [Candidatus Micrarchaeota archaeon]